MHGAPGAGAPAPAGGRPAAGTREPVLGRAGSADDLRRQRAQLAASPPSPAASPSSSAASRSSASSARCATRTPTSPSGGWPCPAVGRFAAGVLLVLAAAALLGYAVAPRMRPWRRWPTVGLCLAFAAVTAWNGVGFYRAWRGGEIRPAVPVPLSFVICACSSSSPGPRSGRRRRGAGGSPRPPCSSSPRRPACSCSRSPRSSSSARPTTGGRRRGRRLRRPGPRERPGLDLPQRPDGDGDPALQGPPREAPPRLRRRGGQRLQRGDRDARHRRQGRRARPATWSSTRTA